MGARDARRRGEALYANKKIVPEVAQSAGKVSEFEWDIDLKPDYKFSDGTPVTAQDVANCLNELHTMNPLGDIEAGAGATGRCGSRARKPRPSWTRCSPSWVA